MWLNDLNADQRRSFLGLAYNVVVSDGLLDPNHSPVLDALSPLTDDEVDDIVAFLKTLMGEPLSDEVKGFPDLP